MPEENVSPLSKSALGAALIRAAESERPDSLISDPFAPLFLDAAPDVFADEGISTSDPDLLELVYDVFAFHAVMRGRFFDDELRALAENGCRQFVVLAAGLDSRALRCAWPTGTKVFELDLPDLFDFKEPIIAKQVAHSEAQRRIVTVDLRDDWIVALLAASFDPSLTTAWLAEGLLVYLTEAEVARLLSMITTVSADGSALLFDDGPIVDDDLRSTLSWTSSMEDLAHLWNDRRKVTAPERLTRQGWDVEEISTSQLAPQYGRSRPRHAEGSVARAWLKHDGSTNLKGLSH
jgi:methyltransferase (TIGR00027 family)